MEIILFLGIAKYLSNIHDNRTMKTLNTKFIVALTTTLFLTGCMPDSLTKFKKDAPKKAATTSTVVETPPPFVDDSGNEVDPDTLDYPTTFYFTSTTGGAVNSYMTVGTPYQYNPFFDGTMEDTSKRSILFVRCELDVSGAVITRTLPPGMVLDSTTCEIKGTPLNVYSDTTPGNVGGTITYNVRMVYKGAGYTIPGTESTLSAPIALASYKMPGVFKMSQNDKLQMKITVAGGTLASLAPNTDSLVNYNRYGILTSHSSSGGTMGVVKYVNPDTLILGVNRVQPLVVNSAVALGQFAVNGFVSTSGNVKRGKVVSINSTTRTMYVEAITPNTVFATGDALDNASTYLSAKATVTSVSNSYMFNPGARTDNDTQYYSNKFTIDQVVQTYERGVAIAPITPFAVDTLDTTLTAANEIEFSISPALPAGLTMNPATGVISGTFTSTLDSTEFTVNASNKLGESEYIFHMAAIDAPRDLSYSTRQLIAVQSNTLFLEGENLYQPITPPLTTSVMGNILRKVSTNMLSIDTINGPFLSLASIDSGNAYYSEKSYVTLDSSPNYYDVSLKVSTTTNFAIGDYISTPAGAKGRVIYVDTANSVIYLQFLTPSVVSSTPGAPVIATFAEGLTVDDAYPFVGAEAVITQVEAANIILNVSPIGVATINNFSAGKDITSNAKSSAYIYGLDSTNDLVKVNEIARNNGVAGAPFITSQIINIGEYATPITSSATILGVTHDNLIVVERGVPKVIHASISQGSSVIYSILPALPPGLTLNTLTGVISGTATIRAAKKTYVVTATNLLDKSYYAFDMEIRDYFTLTETSGAKSFITHKTGDDRLSRSCRINATDILNSSASLDTLDVRCNLEAEELDLYYTTLKLSAMVGPGSCEYIGFRPFSFWQYAPYRTSRTVNFANECSGGSLGSDVPVAIQPTAANVCYGNYEDNGGPNCDSGAVTVRTHAPTTTGGPCATVTTTTISCGGKKTNCLAGPVTSVFSATDLEANVRLSTVASSGGATKTWPIKSSFDFLDTSNLRNANNITNNTCTQTRTDANDWYADQNARAITQNPFGKENPFYEFTCLDSAKDVKARIRLTVRDWNRAFRINDLLDAVIPPKMNDASASPLGPSYNNSLDWDDAYATAVIAGAEVLPATTPKTYDSSAEAVGYSQVSCVLPAVASECVNGLGASDVDSEVYPTKRTCESAGYFWKINDYPFPEGDI